MFEVMASSSVSQTVRSANVRFNDAIRGKMSSIHTWSGAPFVAHASMYSARYACYRVETGPSDALIR